MHTVLVSTVNYTLLSEAIIIVCLECFIICSDYRFDILSTVRPSLVIYDPSKYTSLETILERESQCQLGVTRLNSTRGSIFHLTLRSIRKLLCCIRSEGSTAVYIDMDIEMSNWQKQSECYLAPERERVMMALKGEIGRIPGPGGWRLTNGFLNRCVDSAICD